MSSQTLQRPTPTQTASFKIAAHFEAEEKRHQELSEKREAARKALQIQLEGSEASIRKFIEDRRKKADLMNQNQAEGLDTEKLASRISELDEQITAERAKWEALKRVLEAAKVDQTSFSRQRVMARDLANNGCAEAVAIDGLRNCYSFLPTKLVTCDDTGHPKTLRTHLGAYLHYDVTIKNGDSRYSRHFRPKSLEWLTKQDGAAESNGQDHRGLLAFFDKSSQKFVLSKTRLNHDDFKDVATSLEAHAKELLFKEEGEIDLKKTYSGNDLAKHLKSCVLEMTTAEPQFKPCAENLTSTAIHSRIKDDWNAFVACPWTAEVDRTLALLKYHTENGERPRFWSGVFEGQYGFRLRTRDHSWIVGQVYIEKSDEVPSATSPMQIRSAGYSSDIVASLGRLHLFVDGHSNKE